MSVYDFDRDSDRALGYARKLLSLEKGERVRYERYSKMYDAIFVAYTADGLQANLISLDNGRLSTTTVDVCDLDLGLD